MPELVLARPTCRRPTAGLGLRRGGGGRAEHSARLHGLGDLGVGRVRVGLQVDAPVGEALEQGLTGVRRRRAIIQLASSLRNIGQAHESVELLTVERQRGSDELDDAVSATLALALTSVGPEREAVSIAVAALAAHLPRYQRSMANYARLLVEPDEESAERPT